MRGRSRAVIVDDMALARERVTRYLAGEADVEIVGEAANGSDAVSLIVREGPDVAFLDVGLPDFDGFEVVRRLPSATRPVAIFLTAHGDKALEALDVNASDYLAKPFNRERFARALNRIRATSPASRRSYANARLSQTARDQRSTTHGSDRHPRHRLHRRGGSLSMRSRRQDRPSHARPTQRHRGALDPAEFSRIHRSAIVRIDRVKSLLTRTNGDGDLLLVDGCRLLLSRTYRDRLAERLGLDKL
jgi:two-component system LytT family response regulator